MNHAEKSTVGAGSRNNQGRFCGISIGVPNSAHVTCKICTAYANEMYGDERLYGYNNYYISQYIRRQDMYSE